MAADEKQTRNTYSLNWVFTVELIPNYTRPKTTAGHGPTRTIKKPKEFVPVPGPPGQHFATHNASDRRKMELHGAI